MSSAADPHHFSNPASPPSRASLASWWEKFKGKGSQKKEEPKEAPGIFGVPLQESIKYAKVAISMNDQNGNSFIYGYIPIVIAKCGVFLKDKGKLPGTLPWPSTSKLTIRLPSATDVEGIFRLSGSAKRIKDLQVLFGSPDKYGKGLDWTGYTVHDAANILRRYLNQLPEPIIPLDYYDRFRQPLQGQGTIDEAEAIKTYQRLISEMPPLNRQLLLYILDLLAVFSSKAEVNLMPAPNLAAIFQPGIISHPDHEMSPADYRLSQDVLIFLILNQDNFLLGMRGAEDNNQDDSKAPNDGYQYTDVLNRNPSKRGLDRHPSNSSAGAESVKKFGVKRHASTSSRKSMSSPVIGATQLSRSNTMPSKNRSPSTGTPTFQSRAAHSPLIPHPHPPPGLPQRGLMVEGVSPETEAPDSVVVERPASNATDKSEPSRPKSNGQCERSVSEFSEMVSPVEPPTESADPLSKPTATPLPPLRTPTKEKGFSSYFARSPGAESGGRASSNKLRKKRIPGSQNPSAESSAASLSSSVSHPGAPAGTQTTVPPSNLTSQQAPLPPISASPPGSDNASPPQEARKLSFQAQIPPSLQTDAHSRQLELPNHMSAPHSRGAQSASTASLVQQVSQTPSQASSLSSQSSQQEDGKGSERHTKHKSIWRKSAQKLNLGAATQSASEKLSGLISPPFSKPLNSSGSLSSLNSNTRQRSRSVGEKAGESPKESVTLPQRGASASAQHNPSSENVGAIGWLQRKMNERKEKGDKEKDTTGASQRSLSPNATANGTELAASPKR
ncbi:hypothetical protein DRE_04092 [Drechslerella stenobrocha 248]|uniref:Rho-GAP domain-containing protein n=1 Tax=Drechslerella stenobrocha 248 TaxID=1043628 RepID=W7IC04_9PEZI|nr:hypothetical protein DRE_04092 [Drechslerella stenobrocha 248]